MGETGGLVGGVDAARAAELKKKRVFKVFMFRNLKIDDLVTMKPDAVIKLLNSRQRRLLRKRRLGRKEKSLVKNLREKKKAVTEFGEKPDVVKTHLRGMVVLPEMVGSMVGIHNGLGFHTVEVKPEMIGRYLGEFAITYAPVTHGRPGIGATHSSRFIPLK